jgi:iron complex transport system substrate-binding protein
MRLRIPLAAATAAALLAGCGGGGADPSGTDPPPAGAGFPVTVGDVTLQSRPTAIISLSPTATEMLFAIGAGEQVVAVDEFSDHPPEAPTTDLSGFTPNVEAIASYDPDLVVISYDPGDLAAQLAALEIPVHTVPDNPTDVVQIYSQVVDLGKLTGQADGAAALVSRMADDIDKLVADAPPRDEPLTYYIEIDNNLFTYTSQSLISSLLGMVGLENIAVSDDPAQVTVQLSAEVVVDADPDVILLTNAQSGESAETVSARDGWDGITAVRDGHIVELSPDIASRWGPRIVDLLREVVDAVSQVP